MDKSLPDEVERVLLKALAKQPEARFQNAHEMVDAMEANLAGASTRQGGIQKKTSSYATPPIYVASASAPNKNAVQEPSDGKGNSRRKNISLFGICLFLILLLIAFIAGSNGQFLSIFASSALSSSATTPSVFTSTFSPEVDIGPTNTATRTYATYTPSITLTPSLTPTLDLLNSLPITAADIYRIKRLSKLGFSDMSILDVAFSPDGKTIAIANQFGCGIYDLLSGRQSLFLYDEVGVNSIAFSPDGNILATGSNDGTIKFWNINDGIVMKTIKGNIEAVQSVAFSPDGSELASGGYGMELWRYSTGELIKSIPLTNDELGNTNPATIRSLTFSPNGKWIAWGGWHTFVKNYSIPDGKYLQTFNYYANGVAFTPNGIALAFSDGGDVQIRNIVDGSLRSKTQGYNRAVSEVVFSLDGSVLVSVYTDGAIMFWNSLDGKLLKKVDGLTDYLTDYWTRIVFSRDGTLLANTSQDGTVWIWGIRR